MTTVEIPLKLKQTAGAVIAFVPLDKIVANRYQRRQTGDVSSLAENIKAHGLKQNPVGRWHPERPGVFELADGHRRTAAYGFLRDSDRDNPGAWDRIPVAVQDLTDRQMFETCIIANEQREALSAIERAVSLRDYMAEFKVSQAEAGKLFTNDHGEPLSQGAVSKLVGLLALPDAVQELVRQRALSEVPARALVRLVDWRPDLVTKIAEKAILEPEPSQRAGQVETLIDEALRRDAQSIDEPAWRPWPMEWPGKPLKTPMDLLMAPRPHDGTHQTIPAEVPACAGCPFNLERHGRHYCLRQACFVTKRAMWSEREVARAAEKLGIAAAAPGEHTTVIFPGPHYSYNLMGQAERLVAAKLPELRIVARPRGAGGQYAGDSYGLATLLGSDGLALATVNQGAISVWLAKAAGPTPRAAVPQKKANESPAQTQRRKVAEQEQREERALERIQYNRARADVLWLVEHTAEMIAARTVAAGGLLLFAIDENRGGGSFYSVTEEMRETTESLAKRTGIDKLGHGYGDGGSGWKQALVSAAPDMDQLRRQYLAYRKLTRDVASGKNATDVYRDSSKARETCQSVATETFGVTLPAGWDAPPVHHTPINCWTCGRFSAAGAGKLTKSDEQEGWRALYANKRGMDTAAGIGSVLVNKANLLTTADTPGAQLVGVYCPEHAAQGAAEWNKHLLKTKAAAEDADLATQESKGKAAPAAKSADTGLGWQITAICVGPLDRAKKQVKTADVVVLDAARQRMKDSDLGANGGNRVRINLIDSELYQRKQAAIVTKTATRKATRAAAALASKAPYGRSHTRPAPKPSAAKRRKVAKKGK